MSPDELPRCEFDTATKKFRFWNCAGEADEIRAAKTRIEQNRKQLNTPSGLTNRERRALHNEADVLERKFNLGRHSPVAEMDDKRKERRLRAEGKKLLWFTKKVEQGHSQDSE
jgi:hypothetical protein